MPSVAKPEKDVLTVTILYVNYLLPSYRVEEILGLFSIEASARQIERWPRRFGPSVKCVFKRYKIRFSRVWYVDEKFTPRGRVPTEQYKRGRKK